MRRSRIDAAYKGRAKCESCGIRSLVLFADLRREDFDLIHMPIEELVFDPGAQLYAAGDPATSVFTVRSGLVKLLQYLPDGSQRIVRLLRPGATAGLEALVAEEFAHTAIALQKTEVCRVPREVVERLDRETPRLHTQLMRRWHDALRQADDWLSRLSTGNARERLARFVLSMADDHGALTLLTREDLGSVLGITTEHASRTVSEFKRQGLLTDHGYNRFDADLGRLRQVVDGTAA